MENEFRHPYDKTITYKVHGAKNDIVDVSRQQSGGACPLWMIPRAAVEAMAEVLGLMCVDAVPGETDVELEKAYGLMRNRDARIAELQDKLAAVEVERDAAVADVQRLLDKEERDNTPLPYELNRLAAAYLEAANTRLRAELETARNDIHVLCQALAELGSSDRPQPVAPQRAYYPAILEGQAALDTADTLLDNAADIDVWARVHTLERNLCRAEQLLIAFDLVAEHSEARCEQTEDF